jgi:hypothetical protein
MSAGCWRGPPMLARRRKRMTEIVNLRAMRKQKARAEKEKTAEANCVLHGTPTALRKLEAARKSQADQRISGHRLEKGPDDN